MNLRIFILFIIIALNGEIWANIPDVPEKPKIQTSVYDAIGLLNQKQKLTLEQKLINYADTTSTQIVIANISTTNGQEIGYYATHWAHKWGIGGKDKDNGVLIVVAKDDRKVTIRTGYGVEHLLTDALSKRIIEKVMLPHFRENDYYAGLDQATDVIIKILAGEYQNDEITTSSDKSTFPVDIVIVVVIIMVLIIVFAKPNNDSSGGGMLLSDDIFGAIILGSSGRSSGWGGTSGGGFGGGFGGGGFGGGGASGGW